MLLHLLPLAVSALQIPLLPTPPLTESLIGVQLFHDLSSNICTLTHPPALVQLHRGVSIENPIESIFKWVEEPRIPPRSKQFIDVVALDEVI